MSAGDDNVNNEWFNRAGLDRVYILLRPRDDPSFTSNFGPKRGQPEGVYLFERRAANDPRCKEYYAAEAADAQLLAESHQAFRLYVPAEFCISYSYVGPFRTDYADFQLIDFFDMDAESKGYRLYVSELRQGGAKVVARSVSCVASPEVRPPPRCHGPTDLMTLF